MENELTVTINGNAYTESQVNAMDRASLRTLARVLQETKFPDVSRAWIGSMASTNDLRDFVLGKPVNSDHTQTLNAPASPSGANPAALMVQAMELLASQAGQGASKAELDEVNRRIDRKTEDVTHFAVTEAHKAKQVAIMEAKAETSLMRDSLRTEFGAKLTKVTDERQNELVNYLDHELAKVRAELTGTSKTFRIEVAERAPIEASGLRHCAYDELLADIVAFQATKQTHRANFWLVGPAGTGKTTAAEMLAGALGLPFYFNGAIDSEYKLRGFIDAQGRIIATPFRKAYAEGGVYLFDEVDSSLPSACLAFNAALANGKYDFPGLDDPVPRHHTCIVLAASNTWGGPDGGYVGRFRQDAAFMDRFMRVPWETDEKLESALCQNKSWCTYVQGTRAKAIANGVEHLISPRATLNGDVMLAAGRPWARVVDLCVRKGLNDADWQKITGGN